MTKTAVAITALGFMLAAPMVAALAHESDPPAGDIQAGEALSAACASCHGELGMGSDPGVPHLAGQHAAYLLFSLKAYRDGSRNHAEMREVAGKLSDADMVNLAAYYASQDQSVTQAPVNAAEAPPAEEDPFAEVREATAECAACHGEDGNADIPGTPSLAGQHVAYLIGAIKSYRDGSRKEDEMQAFAEGLGNAEIEDMAYYYAAMAPNRATGPAEGDAFAGLAVTAPCVGCHALDGNSKDPKTPRIAGLDAEYLAAAVKAYKNGNRAHDAMRDAVTVLREQDIRNLAAYYASKEPKALPVRKPLTTREWVARCNRCHGPGGRSTDSRFPVLAGQDEAYLAKSLKLYHGGERPSSTMQAMSFLMAESDIRKLAAWYARQPVR